MGNIFTDWMSFRLNQKKRDFTMSASAKARSKAFGAIKKSQDGMKSKLKKGKKDPDEDEDEDEEEEEKPAAKEKKAPPKQEKKEKAAPAKEPKKPGSPAMAKKKVVDEEEEEEKPRAGFRGPGGIANKTVAIRIDQIEPLEVVGWVVALNGNHRGQDWRLHTGKNVIGTAADCDIVVTDPYLSAKHATIRHDSGDGSFTIIDLDSTNGTYLNDKRINKDELIDNDTVRLGRTELKFKALF